MMRRKLDLALMQIHDNKKKAVNDGLFDQHCFYSSTTLRFFDFLETYQYGPYMVCVVSSPAYPPWPCIIIPYEEIDIDPFILEQKGASTHLARLYAAEDYVWTNKEDMKQFQPQSRNDWGNILEKAHVMALKDVDEVQDKKHLVTILKPNYCFTCGRINELSVHPCSICCRKHHLRCCNIDEHVFKKVRNLVCMSCCILHSESNTPMGEGVPELLGDILGNKSYQKMCLLNNAHNANQRNDDLARSWNANFTNVFYKSNSTLLAHVATFLSSNDIECDIQDISNDMNQRKLIMGSLAAIRYTFNKRSDFYYESDIFNLSCSILSIHNIRISISQVSGRGEVLYGLKLMPKMVGLHKQHPMFVLDYNQDSLSLNKLFAYMFFFLKDFVHAKCLNFWPSLVHVFENKPLCIGMSASKENFKIFLAGIDLLLDGDNLHWSMVVQDVYEGKLYDAHDVASLITCIHTSIPEIKTNINIRTCGERLNIIQDEVNFRPLTKQRQSDGVSGAILRNATIKKTLTQNEQHLKVHIVYDTFNQPYKDKNVDELWYSNDKYLVVHKRKTQLTFVEIRSYQNTILVRRQMRYPMDGEWVQYKRQAQSLNTIQYIPMVYGICMQKKTDYMFVAMETLESLPTKFQTISDLLDLIKNILTCIKQLHKDGYVHRDIKPSNMMCSGIGEVKLIDFDLTIRISETHTQKKYILGTPQYRAPEVGVIVYDERVDVYSAGVSIAELIHGGPFDYYSCDDSGEEYDEFDSKNKVMQFFENFDHHMTSKSRNLFGDRNQCVGSKLEKIKFLVTNMMVTSISNRCSMGTCLEFVKKI
ncbi:hypothetical protein AKO1_012419 [Acrasis kona]|uniref:Protein kinase domain-containing protein n=1 Tax=Acrasis kona TaxID=1008807 RepID=A0AAW2YYM6_9EUKA